MEGRLKIHRDPFRLRCWLRVTVNCHLCPERYRVFSHRGNGCPGVSLTLNKLELAFDVQSYSPTQVALRRLTRAEADCWQGGEGVVNEPLLIFTARHFDEQFDGNTRTPGRARDEKFVGE